MVDRGRVDDISRQAANFGLLLATLAGLLAATLMSPSFTCAADPMDLDQPSAGPMEVEETFYDAPDEMQDASEIYYDAEDEIKYDEDVEANVCIMAGRGECQACCRQSELDNAFWNQQVGQCLCYRQVYEEGLCTASHSAEVCEKCCSDNHYLGWNFDPSGRSMTMCTCLEADTNFYQMSFY